MAKWTWEVLVRTETTLKTESLLLCFSPYCKSCERKIKAPLGTHRSCMRLLAYNGHSLTKRLLLTKNLNRMNAIEFLKQNRVYEDETIYNMENAPITT